MIPENIVEECCVAQVDFNLDACSIPFADWNNAYIQDVTLQTVKSYIIQGWPEKKFLSKDLKDYWELKHELSIDKNFIWRNGRVIPHLLYVKTSCVSAMKAILAFLKPNPELNLTTGGLVWIWL